MRALFLTVIGACFSTVSALAGTNVIYVKQGEPFEMTGIVVGYDGGNCIPEKLTYELVSTDHVNKIWLCARGDNEMSLHRAMLDRGFHRINGTLIQGAERPYVEVENVHDF